MGGVGWEDREGAGQGEERQTKRQNDKRIRELGRGGGAGRTGSWGQSLGLTPHTPGLTTLSKVPSLLPPTRATQPWSRGPKTAWDP